MSATPAIDKKSHTTNSDHKHPTIKTKTAAILTNPNPPSPASGRVGHITREKWRTHIYFVSAFKENAFYFPG